MSSILDALKKLESEKTEEEQPEYDTAFGTEDAEHDLLVPLAAGRESPAITLTPLTILVAGGLLVCLIAVVSAAGAMFYAWRSGPPIRIQHASELPSSTSTSIQAIPATSSSQIDAPNPFQEPHQSNASVSLQEADKPAAAVSEDPNSVAAQTSAPPAQQPQNHPTTPPETLDKPGAVPPAHTGHRPSVDKTPKESPIAEHGNEQQVAALDPLAAAAPTVPTPSKTSLPPTPVPATVLTEKAPEPVEDPAPAAPSNRLTPDTDEDVSQLPILTNTQRSELGLPELTINFVGMPTKRQPRPSALINLKKVYVGEPIPGTRARLVGVELSGIGIEVDGQRFFVPN